MAAAMAAAAADAAATTAAVPTTTAAAAADEQPMALAAADAAATAAVPPTAAEQEQEQPTSPCNICREPLSALTAVAVEACAHRFCGACLRQWAASRTTQPLCPVCRAAVLSIVLADGSREAVQPGTAAEAAAAAEEPDLSCLDHAFFTTDVDRLLSRANSLHNRLLGDAYGGGRRGGCRATQSSLLSTQDALSTLQAYSASLAQEVRFDAQMLLSELYRIDRQLTSLQAGGSGGGSGSSSPAAAGGGGGAHPFHSHQQQRRMLSADDAAHHHHHLDDDDYDDDDDDDSSSWGGRGGDEHDCRLHRTPGRRPGQRHGGAKHAPRSGSAGQQHAPRGGRQAR